MSASTTQLLEQIVDLELSICEFRAANKATKHLEDLLIELKERLQLMNEALENGNSLIKG